MIKNLPWHVGFYNEITSTTDVKYKVYNICDEYGRVVAWAISSDTAEKIVNLVNKEEERND